LDAYLQGGLLCCDDEDADWTYVNSFLFADANEAYVLETAGQRQWAWDRIDPGIFGNISNGISVRSNWGAMSKDIES
jgi:dipeptidase